MSTSSRVGNLGSAAFTDTGVSVSSSTSNSVTFTGFNFSPTLSRTPSAYRLFITTAECAVAKLPCLAKPSESGSGSRYSTSMTNIPFCSVSWIFWPLWLFMMKESPGFREETTVFPLARILTSVACQRLSPGRACRSPRSDLS